MKKKKLQRRLAKLERELRRTKQLKTIKAPSGAVHVPEKKTGISDAAFARLTSGQTQRIRDLTSRIYAAAQPMPGVVPAHVGREATMAMDDAIKRSANAAAVALDEQIVAFAGWTGGGFGGYGSFAEGQMFLGYPYLAELAQRPEYRMISETFATESTRKWIKFKAKNSEGDKTKQIAELEDEFKRLRVQETMAKTSEYDGYFGRNHIFLDFGAADDKELLMPVGDGQNKVSEAKVTKGSLKRIQNVEAVWCYPASYNSNDPLSPDWYKPQRWFAMGKEIHASRFLTFVGREVPDMLKPAYSFGGLSMSQLAKPYVDNWLRTRQSVSDIVHAFTVFVLKTNMMANLNADGSQTEMRMKIFNHYRDNKGLMMIDKDAEDFVNVTASLATLDTLQAQSQEQLCSVSRTPTVKLLGIDAHGLNASSEGSIRTYYDTVHAIQPKFYGPNLDRIFRFAQINIWGAVDPDLTYEWVNLWSLDEKGEAEVRKIDADTDAVLIESSVLHPAESRIRVAGAEDSPYSGLDVNDVPEAPEEVEPRGLGFGQGGGLSGGEPFAQDEVVIDAEKVFLREQNKALIDRIADEPAAQTQPINISIASDSKAEPQLKKTIRTRRDENGLLVAEVVTGDIKTETIRTRLGEDGELIAETVNE